MGRSVDIAQSYAHHQRLSNPPLRIQRNKRRDARQAGDKAPDFATISFLMLPQAIKKILAYTLPFYLLLQFFGCLSACALEVAGTEHVTFGERSSVSFEAAESRCGIENLPKLTATERVPKNLQVGLIFAARIIRPVSLYTAFSYPASPDYRSHFQPQIRRPVVLRI